MGEPRLDGERRLNSAVAVETMAIDRSLMMQPGSTGGFCNPGLHPVVQHECSSTLVDASTDFHTVIGTVDWKGQLEKSGKSWEWLLVWQGKRKRLD